MILTITMNPSMDYVYYAEEFKLGEHNRLDNPTIMPGGKGINCARALSSMGEKVKAFTVLGGENGELICRYLNQEKFELDIIKIAGNSRNAITVMDKFGAQTEIVERGPQIGNEEAQNILSRIESVIIDNPLISVVTINGTVNSHDPYFYNKLLTMIKNIKERNITVLMDLSRDALINIYNSKDELPDFIKPNEKEFGELVGKKINSKDDVLVHLNDNDAKIPNVLVSFGDKGAIGKIDNMLYDITIPKINAINPTGSGDSTIAGIAYGISKNLSDLDILKTSMAFGMANSVEKGVGVVNKNNVNKFAKEVKVKKIDL